MLQRQRRLHRAAAERGPNIAVCGEVRGKAWERAIKEEIICSVALNFCTEQLGCVCWGAVASPYPMGMLLQCFSRSLRRLLALFMFVSCCAVVWLWLLSPTTSRCRPPTTTRPPQDLVLARMFSNCSHCCAGPCAAYGQLSVPAADVFWGTTGFGVASAEIVMCIYLSVGYNTVNYR